MWKCPNCRAAVDDHFEICWGCGSAPDGTVDRGFQAETEGIITAEDFQRGEDERLHGQMVTVGTFLNPGEAELFRNRLEAEGIPSYVADELMSTTAWERCSPSGGAKVQVPEKDAGRARLILEDMLAENDVRPEVLPWREPDHRFRI